MERIRKQTQNIACWIKFPWANHKLKGDFSEFQSALAFGYQISTIICASFSECQYGWPWSSISSLTWANRKSKADFWIYRPIRTCCDIHHVCPHCQFIFDSIISFLIVYAGWEGPSLSCLEMEAPTLPVSLSTRHATVYRSVVRTKLEQNQIAKTSKTHHNLSSSTWFPLVLSVILTSTGKSGVKTVVSDEIMIWFE